VAAVPEPLIVAQIGAPPCCPASTHRLANSEGKQHAEHEPSDVRHPRDTTAGVEDELRDQPGEQQVLGLDLDKEDQAEEQQGADACVREPNEIRAHHAGNCARSPNHRHCALGLNRYVSQRRDNAAGQVEHDVSRPAKVIFDVVAEDPQEQHVETKMQPAAVQKHRHGDCDPRAFRFEHLAPSAVVALAGRRVSVVRSLNFIDRERPAFDDLAWNRRILVAELDVLARAVPRLDEHKHRDVGNYQRDRDPCSACCRILIVQWDHTTTLTRGAISVKVSDAPTSTSDPALCSTPHSRRSTPKVTGGGTSIVWTRDGAALASISATHGTYRRARRHVDFLRELFNRSNGVRGRSIVTRRRLDIELLRRGLVGSRRQAQERIAAGLVTVGGAPAMKPARLVSPGEAVEVAESQSRYVSRGGYKLEAALDGFDVDPTGRAALDAGASTGGFTDCLLQHGCRSVVAVDVGYGQLDIGLRTDDRVICLERTNARHLSTSDVEHPVDLVVADLSFIGLATVLPGLVSVSTDDAEFILLVKPQFEAGRSEANRGKGVIRDPAVWQSVLENVVAACLGLDVGIMDVMASPLRGPEGNREFLIHGRSGGRAGSLGERIDHVVSATAAQEAATR